MKHNIPFVLPVETGLGKYVYEVGTNEILKVNDDLFGGIVDVLTLGQEIDSLSDSVKKQYRELQELGYLSSRHVEEVSHPASDYLEDLLTRGVGKLTLQVTQACNLRCKYCIYSETSNPYQRNHSSQVMSVETAKKAVDFYKSHSIDTDDISVGFYGGEPLLAFSLIKEVTRYSEKIFSPKLQ